MKDEKQIHLNTLASLQTEKQARKKESANILKSEKTLYGIGEQFFDTPEELEIYCKNQGISKDKAYMIDYIRSFGNRSDVIRQTYSNGKIMFLAAASEESYGIYNQDRSCKCGKFIWEVHFGSLANLYKPFRERKIIFENDIFDNWDKWNERVRNRMKEKNLFGMKK